MNIESFFGYVKTRLVEFKGMNKSMFTSHLGKFEFRFSNHKKDLEITRKESLKLV